jgi:hypothetical protein
MGLRHEPVLLSKPEDGRAHHAVVDAERREELNEATKPDPTSPRKQQIAKDGKQE